MRLTDCKLRPLIAKVHPDSNIISLQITGHASKTSSHEDVYLSNTISSRQHLKKFNRNVSVHKPFVRNNMTTQEEAWKSPVHDWTETITSPSSAVRHIHPYHRALWRFTKWLGGKWDRKISPTSPDSAGSGLTLPPLIKRQMCFPAQFKNAEQRPAEASNPLESKVMMWADRMIS